MPPPTDVVTIVTVCCMAVAQLITKTEVYGFLMDFYCWMLWQLSEKQHNCCSLDVRMPIVLQLCLFEPSVCLWTVSRLTPSLRNTTRLQAVAWEVMEADSPGVTRCFFSIFGGGHLLMFGDIQQIQGPLRVAKALATPLPEFLGLDTPIFVFFLKENYQFFYWIPESVVSFSPLFCTPLHILVLFIM